MAEIILTFKIGEILQALRQGAGLTHQTSVGL